MQAERVRSSWEILSRMITLLCPVRDCGAPLTRGERAYVCARGHSFDRARSGYYNLLQPQDRKSKEPGDPRAAVLARRRFLEAGHGALLLDALRETPGVRDASAVLDVGCGEGFYLGNLASERPVEACGIDISSPAVDLAARRYPGVRWLVVNADRTLPFSDSSFDLALSLTARRNAPEVHRVLKPQGRLIVAVPGEDDLVEAREAVLGERVLRNRVESVLGDFAARFALESARTLRRRERLEPEEIRDALAATYRGARESERRRLEELTAMVVTLSYDLLVFQPRG
jgi:23S rRNA (guanine745-N1)-methyltransferase